MNASRSAILAVCFAPLLALVACGDDTSGSGGSGGGSGGSGTTATSDAASTSGAPISSTVTSSVASSTQGSGGDGSGGDGTGGSDFIPTAETIQFGAIAPLPEGEQILFNDWNAAPNTVATMGPDGADATMIFEAYRVWSMGVSNDGHAVAFSSGDPEQEAHYGITIGDAIQHTFVYDAVTEVATALTWGNINDECHSFSADDASLYICRRSDFRVEDDFIVSEGYDAGRVDLATGDFELLLPDDDDVMTLSPQPDADEETALVTWIDLPSTRSIRSIDLASGDVEVVRESAGNPTLSPDGERYLFNDYGESGSLWADDVAGGDAVLVADAQASGARWSPDGTRVVYMVFDDALSCSHVDTVAADGSEADAPTRIRDCGETGEFITDLAWITR